MKILVPVDKFDIEDAKEYLYDELNFKNSHQSDFHPRENVNSAFDVFNILYDHFMISESGKTILNKTIIGTKENIVSKVNDYISLRISNDNLIPVKEFVINI